MSLPGETIPQVSQYPGVNHAKVKLQVKKVGDYEALKDNSWLKGEFIMTATAQCHQGPEKVQCFICHESHL
jgi:hypothetical protein